MKNFLTRSFLSYADLNKEAMKDLEAGGGDENQDERQMAYNLRVFYEESILDRRQDVTLAACDRIDRHILEVVKTSLCIRGRLEDMGSSKAGNPRLPCCSKRIMTDFMMEVRRHYFTVSGEVPSDEVLEKMLSEGKSEEILRTAIYSSGLGKVFETFSEIQDRYYAAKDVENNLPEFHLLFLDMAVLVDLQVEKMNDIEHHVSNAASYIKGGTKELNSA